MDSQQGTDWSAIHLTALQCLSAASDLNSFARDSQESDYDVESAARHLAAIDRAYVALDRAIDTFSPGVVALFGDWHYSSADFDAIARATVGEGARPNFRFGGICCATAHQSAYVLLRFALVNLESAIIAELDRTGVDDSIIAELDRTGVDDSTLASIDALRALSPEALRDTLIRLEKVAHVGRLFAGQSQNMLRAWIDREWAAVSRAPGGPEIHVDDIDLAILTALKNAHPKLLTQEQIENDTDMNVSVRTIQRRLPTLESQGLVCRGSGNRGLGITARGLQGVKFGG